MISQAGSNGLLGGRCPTPALSYLSLGVLFIVPDLSFLIKTLERFCVILIGNITFESPVHWPCSLSKHCTSQSILTLIWVEQILSIVPPVWAYVAVDSVFCIYWGCSCLHISLSCHRPHLSVWSKRHGEDTMVLNKDDSAVAASSSNG